MGKKCLFVVKINIKEEFVFIICLVGAIGAILLAQSAITFDFKILLTRVLYLMFWYETGYYYKLKLEQYDKKSNAIYFKVTQNLRISFYIFRHLFYHTISYLSTKKIKQNK